MGIIQRQAIVNTLATYVGVALGVGNNLIFFQRFLTDAQIGLIRTILNLSYVAVFLGSAGMLAAVLRFFPDYKTQDGRHGGLVEVTLTLGLLGFGALAGLMLLTEDVVLAVYHRAPLLQQYYLWVLPLALVMFVFTYVEALQMGVYRTVLGNVFREVGFKALTTVGVILMAAGVFAFPAYMPFLTVGLAVITGLYVLDLVAARSFRPRLRWPSWSGGRFRTLVAYGGYAALTGVTVQLAQMMDSLMLAETMGLGIVGIYTTYFFMALILVVPARALQRVIKAVITHAWAQGDRPQVRELYRQSTRLNLLITLGLLVLVGVNQPFFCRFLKPHYCGYFGIYWLLGTAFLLDAAGGIAAQLLPLTRHYRAEFLLNILMLVAAYVANRLLIPTYGGEGAALATAIAFGVVWLLRWVALWVWYGLQPYGWRHLMVVAVAGLALLPGLAIPHGMHWLLDLVARSAASGAVLLAGTLAFNLAPEGTQLLRKRLAAWRAGRGR